MFLVQNRLKITSKMATKYVKELEIMHPLHSKK